MLNLLLHTLAAQSAIDKFFLPTPASNLAKDVDWAWNFILGISIFFFCVVVGAMTVFVIKYRRRHPNQQTSTITHNTPLEIIWTGVPLLIVLAIFGIGFAGFMNYDTPASNAVPIEVQTKKWQFNFTYANGATDANLYLLKGTPYVLNLQSEDVLHALYIPAFRTQRNAVPGRITKVWFIPTIPSTFPLGNDPGGYDLFCTQYCGEQHSKMNARVYVYNDDEKGKADYEKKMIELANPFKEEKDGVARWIPYAQVGQKLYGTYCAQCHSVDGSRITGPSWKGLYKDPKGVEFAFPAGTSLAASASDKEWEDYLEESILHPEAKIVNGYQNQMPSFAAQLSGGSKDEKRRAIIEYIKSIGSVPYTPAADPKKSPELFDPKTTKYHPESLAFKNPPTTEPAK